MNYINIAFILLIFIFALIQINEMLKLRRLKSKNLLTDNRFKLFAVRDRFISLVATGDLKEDDIIFKFFVSYINILIRYSGKLTASNMVVAIAKARRLRESDAYISTEYVIDCVVQKKNQKVKDAVNDLFKTIALIVYDNSPSLQLIIWVHLKIVKPLFGDREEKEKVKKVVISTKQDAELYYLYDREYPEHLESKWAAAAGF